MQHLVDVLLPVGNRRRLRLTLDFSVLTAVPMEHRNGSVEDGGVFEGAIPLQGLPEQEPTSTMEEQDGTSQPPQEKRHRKVYRKRSPSKSADRPKETTNYLVKTPQSAWDLAKQGARTAFRRNAREKQVSQSSTLSSTQIVPNTSLTQQPANYPNTAMMVWKGNVEAGLSKRATPTLSYNYNKLASPTAANGTHFEPERTIEPLGTSNTNVTVPYRRPIPYSHTTVLQQHEQHRQQPLTGPPPPTPPPKTSTEFQDTVISTPKREAAYPDVSQDSPQSVESNAAQASSNFISGPGLGVDVSTAGLAARPLEDTKINVVEKDVSQPDLRYRLQVSEIRNTLWAFYDDYPSMREPKRESIQSSVTALTAKAGELHRTLESTSKLYKETQAKVSSVRPLELRVRELENQLRSCKTELQDCRNALAQDRDNNTQTQIRHQYEMQAANGHIARLQQENRDLQVSQVHWTDARQRIDLLVHERDNLQSRLDTKVQEAILDKEEALSTQERKFDQERRRHYDKIQRLKEEHENAERKAKDELDEQLYQEEIKYNKMIKDHDEAMYDMEKRIECVQNEKAALQQKLETQKTDLVKEYDMENQQLRAKAEKLKMAFAERSHFKGLRDRDIGAKFGRLATEVEDLSTMDWDYNRSSRWPVPEDELRRLHPQNTRLLKQQIVQNTLWVLLYKHVLQSPFKIMGSEGENADSEWHHIYTSGKFRQTPSAEQTLINFRQLLAVARGN